METSNPLLRRGIGLAEVREASSMNLEGVVNKTGILLVLCASAGAFAWMNPDYQGAFILAGMIGGLAAFLVGMFVPTTAAFSAPIYAIMEGLCLGALSQILNARLPGVMVNAVLLTFAVLALMLAAYATRIIRVTQRLMIGVVAATGAVALVYLVDLGLRLFGIHMPLLNDAGPVGIAISLVIVGIAAFNLLLDFSVIESNVKAGAPKYMEWYCGMALLVTLVWLYLELLRLLSKLRSR